VIGPHPFTGDDPDGFCKRCHGVQEHPDHGSSILGPGWQPDHTRPGYFLDPNRPGYLRDEKGHWYDVKDVDGVRREVDKALEPAQAAFETFEERFRRRLRERGRP